LCSIHRKARLPQRPLPPIPRHMSKAIEIEPKRRRVFAIISHPDAGKTTLTENMQPPRYAGP